MQKVVFILLFCFISLYGFGQVEVIKYPKLDNYIKESNNSKVRVINFWATWCGPCVKELPFIDSLQYQHEAQNVEVLLVSLDFPDQLSRVNKFLERKNISSEVWLLDESDANSFIDRVDPSWSGAIPATLLINSSGERIFLEKELTKEELDTYIENLLN